MTREQIKLLNLYSQYKYGVNFSEPQNNAMFIINILKKYFKIKDCEAIFTFDRDTQEFFLNIKNKKPFIILNKHNPSHIKMYNNFKFRDIVSVPDCQALSNYINNKYKSTKNVFVLDITDENGKISTDIYNNTLNKNFVESLNFDNIIKKMYNKYIMSYLDNKKDILQCIKKKDWDNPKIKKAFNELKKHIGTKVSIKVDGRNIDIPLYYADKNLLKKAPTLINCYMAFAPMILGREDDKYLIPYANIKPCIIIAPLSLMLDINEAYTVLSHEMEHARRYLSNKSSILKYSDAGKEVDEGHKKEEWAADRGRGRHLKQFIKNPIERRKALFRESLLNQDSRIAESGKLAPLGAILDVIKGY